MNLDFITNILFPRSCVHCRKTLGRGAICPRCFSAISLRATFFCGECFVPIAGVERFRGGRRPASSHCHPDHPYILGGAGDYRDPALQALIIALKFRSIEDAAVPLSLLLSMYIARIGVDLTDFIVMPVPLSRRRERMRGFNQTELIARHFARRHGFALDTRTLARVKHAKPQSETTSAEERAVNVRGAYEVRGDGIGGVGSVRGAKIILIDDVTTSGTTFLEASLALKAAGADTIIALAAAKA